MLAHANCQTAEMVKKKAGYESRLERSDGRRQNLREIPFCGTPTERNQEYGVSIYGSFPAAAPSIR